MPPTFQRHEIHANYICWSNKKVPPSSQPTLDESICLNCSK